MVQTDDDRNVLELLGQLDLRGGVTLGVLIMIVLILLT